jgi:hypothetical protein
MSVKCFEPLAMISSLRITPSPERGRGNGPETRPGIKPTGRGNVISNLPAIARTLALQGGEEVSSWNLVLNSFSIISLAMSKSTSIV